MAHDTSHNGTSKDKQNSVLSEANQLEVRSAEVQEIIGRPPHWLVRSGIAGLLGILILILAAAVMIKYPEVIKAPVRLTAINAPKTLVSKGNGKLVRLFIANNTYARQGQILAWMQSAASHRQVLSLAAHIDSMHRWLKHNELQKIKTVNLTGFSDLGSLQKGFQDFEQAYRNFISFLPGEYYYQKRHMVKQEMEFKHLLLQRLKQQERIQKQQYQLARQEYARNKKLKEKNMIAPVTLEKQRSKLLSSRLPLQQTKSAIINNNVDQVAQNKQLIELDNQINQQQSVFLQSLNTLQSSIDEWKDQYLLTAPFKGKVIYAGILQENQNLTIGQRIFYIKPDNTHFFGEMSISQRSFGKIQNGQKVLVQFSGYPYQEFGSVPGRVSYLSPIPVNDSSFVAKVRFPRGLSTDYGKKLPPRDGMVGHAKIITKDMRLLQRLYNNIASQL